jgi:hypothetical protein
MKIETRKRLIVGVLIMSTFKNPDGPLARPRRRLEDHLKLVLKKYEENLW